MMMTSLPRSVRTSSTHRAVLRNDCRSAQDKKRAQGITRRNLWLPYSSKQVARLSLFLKAVINKGDQLFSVLPASPFGGGQTGVEAGSYLRHHRRLQPQRSPVCSWESGCETSPGPPYPCNCPFPDLSSLKEVHNVPGES